MRALVSKATDVIANELDSEDPKTRFRAAVTILRIVGFDGKNHLELTLPLTPEGVRLERNRFQIEFINRQK
jgi:hypothetical protein